MVETRASRSAAKATARAPAKKAAPTTQTSTVAAIATAAAAVATTTPAPTARRTRSKATASPLQILEKERLRRKRDLNTTARGAQKSKVAEPAPAEQAGSADDDEDGIFFHPSYNSFPTVYQEELLARIRVLERDLAEARADRELAVEANRQLLLDNDHMYCKSESALIANDSLSQYLNLFLAGNLETNDIPRAHYDFLGLTAPSPQPEPAEAMPEHLSPERLSSQYEEPEPEPEEVLNGTEEAIALLRKIDNHTHPDRAARRSDGASESAAVNALKRSSTHTSGGDSRRSSAVATPSRAISTPSSFFSRSLSAIKSTFIFSFTTPPPAAPSTSTTPAPAPSFEPSPAPSRAPRPDTFTESLSTPRTPGGERRQKRRGRKTKMSPIIDLLTRGVPEHDMDAAHKWAKQLSATLIHDPSFKAMEARLKAPVQFQDLVSCPPCEPWKSGFGDPLGDLDDEAIVPVWAVYLSLLEEEKLPKQKRTKTSHDDGMDVDTASLNDTFGSTEPTAPFNSSGATSHHLDTHPRGSREPSPRFAAATPTRQGDNIFGASQNISDSTTEPATENATPRHNPAQGSYGLDYESDEDDTSEIEADGSASPLWTQAPPPAPVPAHAPLPGASQPVDEVERQRQKLMKHTPAKPSRLREAFVPSPSLLSDAGESMMLGTPLLAEDLFDDMPDAIDLELGDDIMAGVAALQNTPEWQAMANQEWPAPIMRYESEEEEQTPSPVDA